MYRIVKYTENKAELRQTASQPAIKPRRGIQISYPSPVIASFRNLCFDPPVEMRLLFNELDRQEKLVASIARNR